MIVKITGKRNEEILTTTSREFTGGTEISKAYKMILDMHCFNLLG